MQSAIDQIRELRALHEDGLLSRLEFDQRKNAVLDASYAPPAVGESPLSAGTELGLMAGQEIGPQNRRYRLERLIAHGGMGQVWQATDLATHAELGHSAQVALKILPPQLTQSSRHAKLLIEEATRARRLAHEHIVRVYEWARDPATASYFIIMEYLEGEDLDSLLRREGALPLARALELLAPVAQALDYAWDKHRLVHRDIKPGNVFVTRKGEVKLLDFGIAARARGSAGPAPLEAPASSGTAGYRAPEAGSPRAQPERTLDVYAVAVMIRQMVQGSLQAAGEPGRPAALTPAQWDALRSGFAADPAARPASVSGLIERLRGGEAPPEAAARAAPQADPQLRILRARQRKEREQAAEAERQARKEVLRQQLLERRARDAEQARLEREAARRKARQAEAAAAYLSEHQRPVVRQSSVDFTEPDAPAIETDGVLRDRFVDGSGCGPELVPIAAGRFQMGSPDHERQRALAAGTRPGWLARETPRHWVGIPRPIAFGRYPVTVGEWRAFALATGWRGAAAIDWTAPGFVQDERHPVVGISWHDAQRYVQWLAARTGRAYRLPSEAEWEFACRAGTTSAYSCGDSIDATQANCAGDEALQRRGTTAVGSYPPNRWGLYDMHGNVWEWGQDVVHDNYDGAPLDGSAWEQGGDQARRILRGGCWEYHPRYLRSALRNAFAAGMCSDVVGLRVVRELT
jgi:formylglycine-generating enzyme required for sulfatase activity